MSQLPALDRGSRARQIFWGLHDAHDCITTGWCNRPIEALGLFRRLEGAVTRVTGARPRHDDARYEERYGLRA